MYMYVAIHQVVHVHVVYTCTVHGWQYPASEHELFACNVCLKPFSIRTTVYGVVVLLLMHAVW